MAENDVKIYSGRSNSSAREQMGEIFDMINYHQQKGNFEKARELGKRLSTLSPDGDDGLLVDTNEHFDQAPTQGVLFQLKVLLTFAAETIIQQEIHPNFLSIMAINAMHDEISNKHPNFFKSMTDGAAFTFYCLALKREGDIAENVGEAFAMLLGAKDDRDMYINIGKKVWAEGCRIVREEIESFNFAK